MSWINLGSNEGLFPGDPDTTTKVEEKGMPFNIQIKTSGSLQGYDLGTIINPGYGSGVILPVVGDVTFERPVSGAIKPRPLYGIVYPVP